MRLKLVLGVSSMLLALAGAAAAADSQLTKVSVASEGTSTTLTLHTTGAFTHNEYRPADNMMLVDLTGVSAGKLQERMRSLDNGSVKSYRVLSYTGKNGAEITRMELSLAKGSSVQVDKQNSDLTLKVTERTAVAAAPAAPQAAPKPKATTVVAQATPAATPAPAEVKPVEVKPTMEVAKAQAPAAPETKAAPAAQSFVMVDAEKPLQMPNPAARSNDAASVMATTIAKDKVDSVVPMATSMPPQNVASNPAQEQQAQSHTVAAPAGPRYTGEPISVNLKDVDLKDFFRLIHEISGLNVVLDPSVKGNVTLVLDDVPWDQALDIVLRNNGLDRQLDGNVLRIASIETLRTEAVARRQQLEAQALAVDKVTVTRFLSYARSADLVPTLKKFLSARGDIISDGRMNALVISDIPAIIPGLDRLIAQLDRKTQEVEIEARVVAATRTFVRELGVQLGGGWGGASTAVAGNPNAGNTSTALTNGTGAPLTSGPFPLASTGQMPLFTNFGVLNPTSGFEILNKGHSYALDLYLSAAEQRGLLKILSRPRVVTQNNVTALVRQGYRLPVVTLSQLNGPPTVTYVDAFLRLTVTPQITVENTIFMAVDVENTTPDFTRTVLGNPILLTQQTTTQVLVTDGGTVTIGGVVQTQNTLTTQEVPIVGDIPILKYLFQHKTTNTQTQELIFFITPKIIQT